MKNYKKSESQDASILDLLKNEQFVQWILAPDEETTRYWVNWIEMHPGRKKDMELARQLIQAAQYEKQYEMPADDFDTVMENIMVHGRNSNRAKKQKNFFSWKLISIAASVVLLGVFGTLLINNNSKLESTPATELAQTIVKKTLKGQKLKIVLPDGSKVTLNAESQLSYQIPFQKNRELTLDGEAFFDVVRDENSPFTVSAQSVRTTVLGTSFNVRAYPEEKESSVAVVTGQVEIIDGYGNQALLSPNSMGVFNAVERQLLIESFDADQVVGWKDGILVFDGLPISDVISQLERIYGVEIHVTDKKILQGNYTGKYRDSSLEHVLEGMSFAVGFTYEIENKNVKINTQ